MSSRIAKPEFVGRCGASLFLFAITFPMQIQLLEHGWATLMSLYPGVEYSYTDSENIYANILRWDAPQSNYNRNFGVVLSTRCTYFHVWAMCIPFFVTRRSIKTAILYSRFTGICGVLIRAILIAGLLVFVINFIRLSILYSAINADVPWWLAHDIPNFLFGMVALGLSMGYFKSKKSLMAICNIGRIRFDI